MKYVLVGLLAMFAVIEAMLAWVFGFEDQALVRLYMNLTFMSQLSGLVSLLLLVCGGYLASTFDKRKE